MFRFRDIKVSRKIQIGFGVVLGLMVLVAVVSYFALSAASDGVDRYRHIARNSNSLAAIQTYLLDGQGAFKDFLATGSEEKVKEFDKKIQAAGEEIGQAKERIKNPERQKIIARIEEGAKGYAEASEKVVQLVKERNSLVSTVADVHGPKAEEALNKVAESAHRDGDVETGFLTGEALRDLLKTRLYVMKYLESNGEGELRQAREIVSSTERKLEKMERTIQHPERRSYLADASASVKEYRSGMDGIANAITERNKLIQGVLNVLGPQIAQDAEDIKSQYKKEQDALGPQITADNAKAITSSIIVALVALVAGIFLALVIARAIVKPLAEMVGAAKELSLGNTDLALHADSKDEIGDLAEAFRKMIGAQKEMAQAAELVAQGDLSATVRPKSEKDVLAVSLKKMIDTMKGVEATTQDALGQIQSGRLKARSDASTFKGSWNRLLVGINSMADVLVGYLDLMPGPVMTIDKERRVLFMNKVGADVIGLSAEQIVGTNCYNHFKTSDCHSGNCACMKSLQEGRAVSRETDAHPGSYNLDISYLGVPIKDGKGAAVGAFEVVTDLTTIKKAQRLTEKNAAYSKAEIDKLLVELGKLAEGDLLTRYEAAMGDEDVLATRENFLNIAQSLNAAVKALHDAMSQVASASEQVSSASAQIASSSQQVASGASEMASSLEETSSSLEEMASMTKQNADNAQQANGLAQTAKTSADGGSQSMGEMMTAMDQIKQASEGTAQIIRDINEIAFQTNLLALNAAVEAARAGEAGRGFAVVAEEVRNLALRSKDAAKRTEDLIKESVRLAGEGQDITKQVNTKLTEIVGVVGKVTDIVGEIATASSEQSRGIEQVNKAVAQMDQVTQQNAANSEESSSAAEELSSQSEELAAMVGRFRLGEQARTQTVVKRQTAAPVKKNGNGHSNGHGNGKGNGNGHHAALHLKAEDVIPLDNDPDFAKF